MITAVAALVAAGLSGTAAVVAAVRSPGKSEAAEAKDEAAQAARLVEAQRDLLGNPNGFRSITAMLTEILARGNHAEERLVRIEGKVDRLADRVEDLESRRTEGA